MEKAESINFGNENVESSASNSISELNNNEINILEDDLHEIFSTCPNNLNIVHINAQSIPAHHLSMLATFVDLYNIDAILVSESFLKESIDLNTCELPGFNLIRNDRTGKGCGGVAIYLRTNIEYNVVDKSPSDYTMSAEHLFIEVYHEETKVLLGVFYSPSSKIDYFSSFKNLLEKYRPLYKHVNILGDFNTDLLKRNKRLKKLLSIVDDQDLHILPLGPTHFAPSSVESILDLIIISNLDNIAKYGQLGSYFSYHDIIYVSYILETWGRRDIPNDTAVVSCQNKEVEAFWKKPGVRKALAEQWKALKIYKESNRGECDLKEYQKSREQIKILEKEFKRQNRKTQKSQIN